METALRAGVWTYWAHSQNNFGDELAPALVRALCGTTAVWAKPEVADLVVTGSVLTRFPDGWRGTVLGAGGMYSWRLPDLRNARVLAIRGTLSAGGTGVRGVALGDAGLLASDLIEPQDVIYDVGLVPHWSDTQLAGKFEHDVLIRPIAEDPLEVVRQIARCHTIISSSLHGVVVADALGIPRRAEPFERMQREGGDFKFHDYASGVGYAFEFGKMMLAPTALVARTQANLREAFECYRESRS